MHRNFCYQNSKTSARKYLTWLKYIPDLVHLLIHVDLDADQLLYIVHAEVELTISPC